MKMARSSRPSTRSNGNQLQARGVSKLLALLILLPLAFIEICLTTLLIKRGMSGLPAVLFIGWLWNMWFCIALVIYILTHRKVQTSGYMEVSNYGNLNKLGKDKW